MRIRIYTDGSCSENPGPGGWGAIFCVEKHCKVLRGNEQETTNNRMELKAVVESIKEILNLYNSGNTSYNYEICSDSAYVVNAIVKGWINNWQKNGWKTTKGDDVKNKDLWEQLLLLFEVLNQQQIDLKFIKVKGHSGNTFNEMVDRVAREETELAKLF